MGRGGKGCKKKKRISDFGVLKEHFVACEKFIKNLEKSVTPHRGSDISCPY